MSSLTHCIICFLYGCCYCSSEHSDKVAEELQRADTVVLTYACDRPETLESLSSFWLPHLRKLEVLIFFIVLEV